MEREIKIDFIGIGAQKSGTSWLFSNLRKLPDFTLLPIKELHYFDRHTKYPSTTVLSNRSMIGKLRNSDWTLKFKMQFLQRLNKKKLVEIRWLLKYFFSRSDDKWYLSLFENYVGLKGEITPSYSFLKVPDIQKMHNLAPDAKLILLLRNPIYRAWSHYLHEWRKVENYQNKTIDIDEVIRFIDSERQSLRSDYEQTIENYLSVYPSSQLLVCFFDAIRDDPDQLMLSIVNFIGGNTAYISEYLNLREKFNVNPKIEMPEEVFNLLKIKYREPIERMALNYGSYFKVWQDEVYGLKNTKGQKTSVTIQL